MCRHFMDSQQIVTYDRCGLHCGLCEEFLRIRKRLKKQKTISKRDRDVLAGLLWLRESDSPESQATIRDWIRTDRFEKERGIVGW